MIYVDNKNIRVQVKKEILDGVLNQKIFHIELEASKYWKKELFDVRLIDDNLTFNIKEIDTISISNGLHPALPVYNYNCIRYFLNKNTNKFIFQLGESIQKV